MNLEANVWVLISPPTREINKTKETKEFEETFLQAFLIKFTK